ncbi:SDR family NAD(P)-dependent oxidoreductase [Jhaorihella thermophila]|uniref:7-alpha-hydroxysteroid dehydrogenase n=1 Tax=Jhaorihella thermophila TaxID=488547 RepID=A0A1H5XJV4_9RHOB|nr:SDR family oxidoreductase [Jhaorihella thermophila]SEG12064.1 7-alpha-hydroxysteroid dehydrogenase [Jhaorihella thermophila]
MSFSIAGKTAIVTGAANGIGLAIGRQFAEAGANVMFADIDEDGLIAELGEQIEEGNVRYFAGDLREKLTVANLLSATVDAFETIDILVNGARRFAVSDPLDPEDDSVMTLMNQNLMSALRLSQQVARRMIRQAEGREEGMAGSIINISSIAADHTRPDLLAYSVSAAALNQMTRSLAVALAPHRIRVNAVAFGSVMSASLQATLKENREYRAAIEAGTPLGRIGAASELADTAQFLASDASEFMTGQVLTVDGGRSLLDPVAVPAH